MLSINTLIIDDEQPAIEELHYYTSQFIDPKNIYDLTDPRKTIAAISDYDIKLVFCDINMPYISGIELVEQISKLAHPPHVVFVTAYDEFAVKAFELNAIDYVLKPIDPDRFKQTITKINSRLTKDQESIVNEDKIEHVRNFINGKITAVGTNPNDRYIFKLSEITHFEAEGPIVYAHTIDQNKKRVHYQMQELENALPENFVRTHKSYIANVDHVARMYLWQKSNYQIELENKTTIPVSRRLSQRVKDKLNW
jgi:DNA-binding LytR/AlgR family response regulator